MSKLPEKFAALIDARTDEPPPAVDWRNSPNFILTLTEQNQMRAYIAKLESELAFYRSAAHECNCEHCPRRLIK